MRFHRFSGEHVRRLAPEDHHKLATSEPLTKMVIKVKHYPDWEIFVKRSSGIRCLDVFQAIFEAFNTPLTPAEKQMLVPSHMRASVEETFRLRCKAWPGLPDAELAHGWKRVDVLQQATLFLGLTQPQAGGDWMLNLGRST
ncbi:hypothetical protein CONPUDRAFT_82214 [Coniophora puteana RWD-64-598 SS2]|uniref:DUF6699 domain-containing protein n=1 Tax=Coniophora puteana (strain RWD-64-598) TaxID=741705 RepID=A0A5M3MPR1_CONPW|nr:uncharacterized protein CONPUDRAFT_82214 [Coniophora puteana RWD-64-598 SS2]EIW81179.1 hypothetical protein CONPUDRAFT_82214 [Coniophora puteana RWD-64-598 SS2]